MVVYHTRSRESTFWGWQQIGGRMSFCLGIDGVVYAERPEMTLIGGVEVGAGAGVLQQKRRRQGSRHGGRPNHLCILSPLQRNLNSLTSLLVSPRPQSRFISNFIFPHIHALSQPPPRPRQLTLPSLKTLIPVKLHYPPSSKTPHCPSCARELSNSMSSFLLSSREPANAEADPEGEDIDRPAKKAKKDKKDKKDKPAPFCCGHVVCKQCVDTIVRPAGRCSVCEAKVGEEGMIPVGKDGEFWFGFV